MTDSVHALTVVLEAPLREDDVQAIVKAILMIKGVCNVQTHIADVNHYASYERARQDLLLQLYTVLNQTP